MAVSKRMRRLASRDRVLKISLEKVLNSQLRKVFDKFMRSFRARFKKTGIILNAHVLTPQLETILTTAYKRTAATFTEQFSIFSKSLNTKQDENDRADEQAQIAISAFIAAFVPPQVALIINTTNNQLSRKIREIAADALATGKTLDTDQLADLVFQDYNQILSSRIPLIGMFNTQNAAEATKHKIATAKGLNNRVWVSILDTKTRKAHAFADGQERPVNVPFIVMEQRLLHPGDTSLGATLNNVMNCRCVALYS